MYLFILSPCELHDPKAIRSAIEGTQRKKICRLGPNCTEGISQSGTHRLGEVSKYARSLFRRCSGLARLDRVLDRSRGRGGRRGAFRLAMCRVLIEFKVTIRSPVSSLLTAKVKCSILQSI